MKIERASVETPARSMSSTSYLLRELGAGITVACLALPLCISAGVLVYSPLGADETARGAVAGLLCAVAGGIVAALARRSSFITTIPTTPIALVQASSVAALAAHWPGDTGATIGTLPIMIMLVGVWQIVFAVTGFSRIIKFTPYPVLAGFVTGIGLLILLHQLPVFAGQRSLGDVAVNVVALHWPHPYISVFGFGLVGAMLLLEMRVPRAPNLLIGLVLGFLVFHASQWWSPDLDLGPTIGTVSLTSLWPRLAIYPDAMEKLVGDYGAVQILLFGSLTLALLGTLDTFFALRTAQQLADIEVAPKRDLTGQGIANLASAIAGGLVVSTSISLSNANYRAGGRGRLSTIAAALVLLFATLLVPEFIFSLPIVVLAAILSVASLRLLDRWTLQTMREALAGEKNDRIRARLNLLVILSVVSATVFGAPVVGAAAGVALSCLIFIIQMSKPIVAQCFSAERIRSKRIRSLPHSEILQRHGGSIAVFELQGILFFGNADDLVANLREHQDRVEIIILDMHRVGNVDTSGIAILQQVARRFANKRKTVVACGVSPKFSNAVRSALGNGEHLLFRDRDTALEWAEEKIIQVHAQDGALLELALHEADLMQQMTREDLDILTEHLQLSRFAAGDVLCRAGDRSDCMWILKRGSVSVRGAADHSDRRLASLGPGCSVGEMGLLEGKPRSADVVADEDVEAYFLTESGFKTILREHPHIGQAMLVNIAQQLARRLRDTSEELQSIAH
jgi:SulP family sulfate permease